MYTPDRPYNDLPQLPPAIPLASVEMMTYLVGAARSMEKLSQLAIQLPNPNVLPDSLGLMEAKASSEIENIITTSEKLLDSSIEADDVTKEVRRYAATIRLGWRYISDRPIDTPLAEEICTAIRDVETTVRKVPGTSLKNTKTGEVVYTPPVGEPLLRNLLGNLFTWLHKEDDVDPLVKAAVFHYQFVAIHPFTDGNGRTARILTVLYLVEKHLLTSPVLFLSGPILKHREDYYSVIQRTTEAGQLHIFINWFLMIFQVAAADSEIRIRELQLAMRKMQNHLQGEKFTSQAMIDCLFSSPYICAKDLIDWGAAGSMPTAYRYLERLAAIGALIEAERVGKARRFINPTFLKALHDGLNN